MVDENQVLRDAILLDTLAVCERFAKEFKSKVVRTINEDTLLVDIITEPGDKTPDTMCLIDLINVCEDRAVVQLTPQQQDDCKTVRQLVDALMAPEGES